MTPNDILRRVRYVFDFSDTQMMSLFASGGREASRAEVSDWLKRDYDSAFRALRDVELAAFLNGLVISKRGAREGGVPAPETELSHNAVLIKLKIALQLRSEDILALLARAGHTISKHELSAFFRKPEHRQYRQCQDQVLRKFLRGLQLQHRGESTEDPELPQQSADEHHDV